MGSDCSAETREEETLQFPGGREVDHARPSHAAHSGARFKTSKLFLSGIFDVIFSDHAVDYN